MEHTWKMLKITCITRRMGFILYVPVPPTLRSRDYLARFKGLICLIHLFPVRCRLEIFFLPPQCIFYYFFYQQYCWQTQSAPLTHRHRRESVISLLFVFIFMNINIIVPGRDGLIARPLVFLCAAAHPKFLHTRHWLLWVSEMLKVL